MKSRQKRKPRPKRPERISFQLKPRERRELDEISSASGTSVRIFKRIRILQLIDDGKSASAAAEAVGIDDETARRIARRYLDGGVKAAVFDAVRPGGTPMLDARLESQIVAMVCSKPPDGLSRWTLMTIAAEVVERGLVEKISDETIRRLLHRHELKPWREKNVVRRKS